MKKPESKIWDHRKQLDHGHWGYQEYDGEYWKDCDRFSDKDYEINASELSKN